MSKLQELMAELSAIQASASTQEQEVSNKIQALLYGEWEDWKLLQDTINSLMEYVGGNYFLDNYGAHYAVTFPAMNAIEIEYRDYFDEYQLRNGLVERHMEKTGCYPGVFRVTQYGDVFPVNTQKK
jgi:hypothetical protein